MTPDCQICHEIQTQPFDVTIGNEITILQYLFHKQFLQKNTWEVELGLQIGLLFVFSWWKKIARMIKKILLTRFGIATASI